MTPGQVEKYRDARNLILELRASPAKKVRAKWGELFGKDPKASRGTPPSALVEEIAAELQERLSREVRGVTRVKVLRRVRS